MYPTTHPARSGTLLAADSRALKRRPLRRSAALAKYRLLAFLAVLGPGFIHSSCGRPAVNCGAGL